MLHAHSRSDFHISLLGRVQGITGSLECEHAPRKTSCARIPHQINEASIGGISGYITTQTGNPPISHISSWLTR